MKPRAYSYIRFSSDKQLGNDSIRRQSELSAKYAEDHGLDLQTDFQLTDVAVSAFTGKNSTEGALKAFLEAVENGIVDKGSYLLVESLDRLSRQSAHTAFRQLSDLIDADIIVVTVSDGQVFSKQSFTQNIGSMFIALGEMIRANSESKHKSERVGASWRNKKLNAANKIVSANCPGWLTVSEDRSKFMVNKAAADLVKRLFNECINGKGVRVIASELNREKVKTLSKRNPDKVWSETLVKYILRSRTVIGEYQPENRIEIDDPETGAKKLKRVPFGEAVKDYYPAIIDVDTFNLAQAAMASRSQGSSGRKGKGGSISNLFSGLAVCGYCGGVMRFYDTGPLPRGGKWLRCLNSQIGNGCTNKHWRYDEVETSFLSFVRETNIRSVVGGVKLKSEAAELRRSIERLNAGVAEDQNAILKFMDRIELTPDLEDVYTARMVKIREEQIGKRVRIGEMETRLSEIEGDGLEVPEEEMADLIASFRAGGEGDRFRLVSRIKSIVQSVVMFRNGSVSEVPDFVDDPQIIEIMNKSMVKQPHYRVMFKNGDVKIVVPVEGNPDQVQAMVKAGSEKSIEGESVRPIDMIDFSTNA
nr:recombinase family protein [Pseudogemmobacter bohemicus]